jgi:WD40 repeat protein
VQAIAVSPDSKLIASGGTDRSIKIWDRETGAEKLTLYGHTDNVLSVAFLAGDKLISSGDQNDRSIKLWDLKSGKEQSLPPIFKNLINPVPLLAVPPDAKKLLAWLPGNERYTSVTAFDPAAGVELFTFNDPPKGAPPRNIYAMAFTPRCDKVVLGAKDGSVRMFDLDKKGEIIAGGDWFVFDKGVGLGDLAFTPDARKLIVGSEAGELRIYQIEGRKQLHAVKGHKQRIGVCQVSADGKRFATAGFDNVVKLWDVDSGKELRSWDMHMLVQERSAFVYNMAFTPDGKALVTANANSSLFILDLP